MITIETRRVKILKKYMQLRIGLVITAAMLIFMMMK